MNIDELLGSDIRPWDQIISYENDVVNCIFSVIRVFKWPTVPWWDESIFKLIVWSQWSWNLEVWDWPNKTMYNWWYHHRPEMSYNLIKDVYDINISIKEK